MPNLVHGSSCAAFVVLRTRPGSFNPNSAGTMFLSGFEGELRRYPLTFGAPTASSDGGVRINDTYDIFNLGGSSEAWRAYDNMLFLALGMCASQREQQIADRFANDEYNEIDDRQDRLEADNRRLTELRDAICAFDLPELRQACREP